MTTPHCIDPPTLVRQPAESLCLDLINTCYWRGTASPTEELRSPSDLLLWVERSGTLDCSTLHRARADWQGAPERAERLLGEALALREALFRIFAAEVAKLAPEPADVDALNTALRSAPDRKLLLHRPEGWVWELPPRPRDPELLLIPVLWSAADLLAGSRLRLVRQCANPQCRWLFLDDSKSGTRRWCSMAACGNRAKAHRHYAKRRQPKLKG